MLQKNTIKVEFVNMYLWDSNNWKLHNEIPINEHAEPSPESRQ